MDSFDEDEEVIAFVIVATTACMMIAVIEETQFVDRAPSRNRDIERSLILKRMYEESDLNCHEMLRMNRLTFNRLCMRLQEKGLCDGRFVGVKEQVAMFLLIIGHDVRNRHVKFDFIRSGETVHRHFHNVLQAIIKLSRDVIKPAQLNYSPQMSNTTRPWYHYFQNCVGAIDGTFIHAKVPIEDQARYRNRKGKIRQNVLVSCSFDMRITYALAGWEGSAHDSRILRNAVTTITDKFTVPLGKYYLGDAGFALSPGFLVPYRGTRYHLNEHRGRVPANANELFNYRHSSLRNVIERVFGLLKKRFAYLRTYPFVRVNTQTRLIIACCVIHNHIMEVDPNDLCEEWETPEEEEHDDLTPTEAISTLEPTTAWTTFRDELAELMWNEYDHRHP